MNGFKLFVYRVTTVLFYKKKKKKKRQPNLFLVALAVVPVL